jgi:hypothetical protein
MKHALSLAALLFTILAAPVEFTVKLETVMKHDDGKFLWFHPRAATIPGRGGGIFAFTSGMGK